MLAFTKIVTAFITPPGLFISLVLLAFIFLRFKKDKAAHALLIITLVLSYLLSTELIRDALLLPLENAYPAYQPAKPVAEQTKPAADYIVVLGGGIVDHSPEEGGKATIATDPMKRLVYAYTLYQQLHIPLLVAGGRVLKGLEVESEAEASVRLLKRLGVPAKDIFTEDQSRNTWENALNVKARYQPRHVLLVTSAYHMPRSMLCFARSGTIATAAPTDYKVDRSHYIITSFLPSISALMGSYIAMKEYLGWIYSWFTLPHAPQAPGAL